MIVVADTAPIHYLAFLGQIELLNKLYGEIHVPSVVLDELSHERTPPLIRQQLENLPPWFIIRDPLSLDRSIDLDNGEVAAISLAMEISADLLLTDDRAAVIAGRMRKLEVIGTLGILMSAHRKRLLDFSDVIERLRRFNFRVSDELIRKIARQLSQS